MWKRMSAAPVGLEVVAGIVHVRLTRSSRFARGRRPVARSAASSAGAGTRPPPRWSRTSRQSASLRMPPPSVSTCGERWLLGDERAAAAPAAERPGARTGRASSAPARSVEREMPSCSASSRSGGKLRAGRQQADPDRRSQPLDRLLERRGRPDRHEDRFQGGITGHASTVPPPQPPVTWEPWKG